MPAQTLAVALTAQVAPVGRFHPFATFGWRVHLAYPAAYRDIPWPIFLYGMLAQLLDAARSKGQANVGTKA